MGTEAIHHKESFISKLELGIKGILPTVARESQRFVISAFSFSVSVVFTSIAVSCASFVGNDFILALSLILSIVTMALCIAVAPVKLILTIGSISFITSIISIIYLLIRHWNEFAEFLSF